MIYVRNNISILTFEWIPIIEVCLQQEIRKKHTYTESGINNCVRSGTQKMGFGFWKFHGGKGLNFFP